MAVESAQQVAREPFERWRFTVDDFMLMGDPTWTDEASFTVRV